VSRTGRMTRAVIISIGDELLSGATVDTNAAYLSARLEELGISTVRHLTVGDDAGAIADAVRAAAEEVEVVLLTGGLGPTADDLTQEGLAAAMGVPLREDPRSAERIAAFFARRGRRMKPSNRKQALLPVGAEAIDNDCGTAPGIAAQVGRAQVYVLPGPPHEMEEMFQRRIAPRLGSPGAIARRLLHTFGAGESDVGERIADLMARGRNPAVGTTVKAGVVTVRISASARTRAEADSAAEETAREVRSRLGELVFGQGDETLAAVTGAALRRGGGSLAVAESCTGGMIAAMITEVPGASEYFLGGVVAYANSAKTDLLGVDASLIADRGAVSEPVAAAMAEGVRARFGADWGIGVTGIAGPTGGSAEKPVGLVFIALAGPAGSAVHRHVFSGSRDIVRRRAALAALNHLRLALGAPAGDA